MTPLPQGHIQRRIEPGDHGGVSLLLTRAFGRPDEAAIVDRLRADGDVLSEMVTEADGALIAHVCFYGVGVHGRLPAVGLGPMGVDPAHQRAGVGTRLGLASIAFMGGAGAAMMFVLGHPAYFTRLGFSQEAAAEFDPPEAWRGPAFMGLRLRAGPPSKGKLQIPRAFLG